MPTKPLTLCIILSLQLLPLSVIAANDLSTLFTTPQERQLINTNRYKSDGVKSKSVIDETDDTPMQLLIREEISVEYRISGISLSGDGAHTAWINSVARDDGAKLDDGSRIKIFAGDNIRVRITAPDGKQYFATSGETLSVSYMAAADN